MAFDFPASPADGQKFTPSGGPTYIWVAATSAWKIQGSIGASGNAYVSDTPPLSPQPGQFWWESDTGNMFMWFDDGNSQQWVQVNVPNVAYSITSINQTMFTTSGTYTKPANLKFLEITCVGGGGGGGVAAATTASQSSAAGGGGGGGTSNILVPASAIAASVAYTVGAGGAGGVGGSETGKVGGATIFAGVTGSGGGGGNWQATTASLGFTTTGGAGGAASAGDVHVVGGSGQMGVSNPHNRPGTYVVGKGGGNPYVQRAGDVLSTTTWGPVAGRAPGGGGDGSATGGSGGITAGGAGAAGCIILREYF